MVVLNKIYTRTGDDGRSALASGERRLKSDPRFEAIGTVDELNAHIGVARTVLDGAVADELARIQNDLFDLGADLAYPGEPPAGVEPLRVTDAQVTRIETAIDRLNADLAPLRTFVLPGGHPAAAALHLCRTVCRRGERLLVALAEQSDEPVNPAAMRYINRLSDYFFVAARWVNDRGATDILWIPGKNR